LEFDQEALQEFVAREEGSPPPVFVGREDILHDIETAGSRVWKGAGAEAHGNPKATRIVQGAPGSGKSSIIAELIKRLKEKMDPLVEVSTVPIPRVVRVSPEMVADDLPKWRAPVILAIDEAQSFTGGRSTTHAGFLRSIHNSDSNLPLLLVLAGLGDTADKAREMNLTRGRYPHEIGSLEPDEVGEFMLAFCNRFGIGPQSHEESLMKLAAPSEGWPRHLHFSLQSLGREVMMTEGNMDRLSWSHILEEAETSRNRYYQRQQSPTMKMASALVGKVLFGFQDKSKITDVVNAIISHAASKNGVEWQLPEGMTPVSLCRHLIHQGALFEKVDNTIALGIPSFRSFLVKEGGFNLPPPSDDMIREARTLCRKHKQSLDEWHEQGSLLANELQLAEQDLAEKKNELANIGILSFQRKRQLQDELAKVEGHAGEIRERQRNRPPPPMPPSPKIMGLARCLTSAETARKEAEDKVLEE